jgi:F0F1-type ATP synthase assembly protein I
VKEKALILCLALLGILGVTYGMATKDHLVFIVGLVGVIAGYLMVRRKLKAYISERYPSEESKKNIPKT